LSPSPFDPSSPFPLSLPSLPFPFPFPFEYGGPSGGGGSSPHTSGPASGYSGEGVPGIGLGSSVDGQPRFLEHQWDMVILAPCYFQIDYCKPNMTYIGRTFCPALPPWRTKPEAIQSGPAPAKGLTVR
jgi:hypothetical protein